MLLVPNGSWQWQYNEQRQLLMLSLGDELEFATPYHNKVLIPDALGTAMFDAHHAAFYQKFIERIAKVRASDAAKVQMALNATAAHFMLQPQMPKSWFFAESSQLVYSEVGKCFQLKTEQGKALAVVVDAGIQASLVMLLSPQLELNHKKSLQQFEVIKVMNNRLQPLPRSQSQTVAA
ncbi:cell division protein ZapC [Paraferrimonas sedimenticola]|uniref:Cell division protein ZapC n=1 Tax=Paraferrimonas sedimenticola TaxID=375674 RepID=A0AA37S070_9GAMM|nr:cell division protein ZapC [Paraferrimonas sedimenticola]GLP98062.1 cell division protein ZapC [Paraferrimonas sedimenticola]